MDITLTQLKKKDFSLARKFAIEGMNLHWYTSNKLELYLYSIYFWYLEVSRATKAYGAYMGNRLVGVLLVEMYGEPPIFLSIRYRFFIKLATFIINLGYKDAADSYEQANQEMLQNFKKNHTPDGEIIFFAVDPTIQGKGIGTLLLDELEKNEREKLVYLYTDSGSSYPFYSHRGFTEEGRKEIMLKTNKKQVPLTCFLFSKRF